MSEMISDDKIELVNTYPEGRDLMKDAVLVIENGNRITLLRYSMLDLLN